VQQPVTQRPTQTCWRNSTETARSQITTLWSLANHQNLPSHVKAQCEIHFFAQVTLKSYDFHDDNRLSRLRIVPRPICAVTTSLSEKAHLAGPSHSLPRPIGL